MSVVYDVTVNEQVERTFLVRGARSGRQAEAMVTLYLEKEQSDMGDGQVTVAEKKGSPVRRKYQVKPPKARTVDELPLEEG